MTKEVSNNPRKTKSIFDNREISKKEKALFLAYLSNDDRSFQDTELILDGWLAHARMTVKNDNNEIDELRQELSWRSTPNIMLSMEQASDENKMISVDDVFSILRKHKILDSDPASVDVIKTLF